MLQFEDFLGALANNLLIALDLHLLGLALPLGAHQLAAKVFNFTDDSFVFLVHRGLLPTREHDDEVELAHALLRSTL